MAVHKNLHLFLRDKFSRMEKPSGDGLILVQIQTSWEVQLPVLYFLSALKDSLKGQILLFQPRIDNLSLLGRVAKGLRAWAKSFAGESSDHRIYDCVGGQKLLKIPHRQLGTKATQELLSEWQAKVKSKEALWNLEAYGVQIGDLIYDQWLRSTNGATVEILDPDFENFLHEVAAIVSFWKDFLERKKVEAVVSSSPYLQGIPLRMAAAADIPAYEINITAGGTRRFSRYSQRPYLEVGEFPKYFRRLPEKTQKEGLKWAKLTLEKRLTGHERDRWILSSTPWSNSEGLVLPPVAPGGVRVVIAVHEFSDSPNIFRNLFPDYFEWLRHLGNLTSTSVNQFLIKPHPDGPAEENEHLAAICKEFPHFVPLDKSTSNSSLLRAGVERVVTMYGSIGVEFAFLGKVAIFASPHNPYSQYAIGIHCRSIAHFDEVILSIGELQAEVNQKEVLEAFFMNTGMNSFSFFYPGPLFPPDPWSWFRTNWNQDDHEKIIGAFREWIASKEYWFIGEKFGVPTAMNLAPSDT